MTKPIVALLYDFDCTLSTQNMQEYTLIPSFGMDGDDFWRYVTIIAQNEGMDAILTGMYVMMQKAREMGRPLTRKLLNEHGAKIKFYKGVEEWFDLINAEGEKLGFQLEHYIISAGLTELIEGSSIARHFTRIFAGKYHYDKNGFADWPAMSLNHTGKTQFLFRVNKGFMDLSDDVSVNLPMPKEKRRVPFRNIMYFGDGLTDVPAMSLTRSHGGYAIAVYTNERMAVDLLNGERVDVAAPADFSQNGILYSYVRRRLKFLREMEDARDRGDKNG